MNGTSTFLTKKYTNNDIYNEIQLLKKQQSINHAEVTKRQDITNGKVKKALWIATTALSLVTMVIGIMLAK